MPRHRGSVLPSSRASEYIAASSNLPGFRGMDGRSIPPFAAGRRWFWLALLGVLAIAATTYTHKALRNRSAFLRWRAQVLQIDQGTDIYQRFQYPNPPIMALLLRPL